MTGRSSSDQQGARRAPDGRRGAVTRAGSRGRSKRRRAERIAREVAADNPDPTTRREAVEQALEAEDLSEEGEHLDGG